MILTFFFAAYPYFGLAGSLLIVLAVIIPALLYSGRKQEPYSIFNHFISELGEVGVSKAAVVFNYGLIAGGIILIPFIIGLGLAIESLWAKLGMLAGIWAAVSVALVGVFPMNNLAPHAKVATSYFRSGLATMLLFGLGIFFQPVGRVVVPQYANIFGGVGVLAYASFLTLLTRKPISTEQPDLLDPEAMPERPRFWPAAALEWAVFFSTILWFLLMALVILS